MDEKGNLGLSEECNTSDKTGYDKNPEGPDNFKANNR